LFRKNNIVANEIDFSSDAQTMRKSRTANGKKKMRWGSNGHIKELLYRSKKKRQICKEQQSKYKKKLKKAIRKTVIMGSR
jgi:hypothetical protein